VSDGDVRLVRAGDGAVPEALVGGKASKLARLTAAGLPVPPWFCLTTSAGQTAGEEGLAAEDLAAARAAFVELLGAEALVAVRSSAVGEDSAKDSFAGQLDTYLHVPLARLEERIAACFASAASDGVRAYREARGIEGVPASAVVVQRMVDARVAGVLFTADPTSGERDVAVVSAGLGLGEGVVADRVETDGWRLALATGEVVDRTVQPKRQRIVLDREAGHGTRVEAVPPDEGDAPALADDQLAELCQLGRQVQALFGCPQDVEWAFDADGALWLLQARPITTLGKEQIFDNSNIVESYPGICSPLTYSFARRGYEETFRESSRRSGVPEDVLAANQAVFANLLALVRGRVYYNILNWYQLFLFVPGFEGVLPAWEKALGLPPRHVERRPPAPVPDRLRTLSKTAQRFVGLQRNAAEFLADFDRLRADVSARDLGELGPHELFELYEEVSRRFLAPYAVSLANDFFTQQLYDQLGKLIERYELGDAGPLRNDLLCGETGMESVEPVRSLLRLAARARDEPAVRAVLEGEGDAATVWSALQEQPGFWEALSAHVAAYGDRTLHELKLETPPPEEDPSLIVSSLRNYLRGGQDVEAMEARERAIRAAAEEQVVRGLRGKPLKRRLFRWVLEKTRWGVSTRENLRLARSRSAGMAKRIFRALGRRLAEGGALNSADDVFFVTVEELEGHLRGASVTADLKKLVDLRRGEWAVYAEEPQPPGRIVTQGPAAAWSPPAEAPDPGALAAGDLLQGVGCSPGRVTAPAMVITEPSGELAIDGQVLVAPMTDPGWVFLMVAAGGLVVERGSLLSHTAIIGRELGIPTVVAVPGATRRISDGQRLELDGQAGTVRLLRDEATGEEG
jgi:pyruvate,water dikinase